MNLAGLETNYQEILFSDNPGQNCRDNSCFSPSPHYNVDFSRSPKSRSVHRSLACFNIVWGEGGRKKGSERRTNVAHITMETCTVNSLLFAQNLTSVPMCFDPDCSLVTLKSLPIIPHLHLLQPRPSRSCDAEKFNFRLICYHSIARNSGIKQER